MSIPLFWVATLCFLVFQVIISAKMKLQALNGGVTVNADVDLVVVAYPKALISVSRD